jgi:hypothetical protein
MAAVEADLPLMQDEEAGSKEELVEVVPAEGSGMGSETTGGTQSRLSTTLSTTFGCRGVTEGSSG